MYIPKLTLLRSCVAMVATFLLSQTDLCSLGGWGVVGLLRLSLVQSFRPRENPLCLKGNKLLERLSGQVEASHVTEHYEGPHLWEGCMGREGNTGRKYRKEIGERNTERKYGKENREEMQNRKTERVNITSILAHLFGCIVGGDIWVLAVFQSHHCQQVTNLGMGTSG